MAEQQKMSWHEMTDEIMTGLRDWRTTHPNATLRDIERELDNRLAGMRARMLEDVAHDHAATTWSDADPPMCPDCHVSLKPHGQRERTLQTRGGHPITLTRAYGVCPQCHRGGFPLDDVLSLVPNARLTPWMHESLVRLSVWMPFSHAITEWAWFTGGHGHRETARVLTEQAGAAAMALTEQAQAAWESGDRVSPPGPDTLVFSVDGAMVPLVGGIWAEVKTLVVGEVHPVDDPLTARPDQTVTTKELTYFSRMTDSMTFGDQSLDELQRRGIEHASRVGVVTDGAEWIQGFIDLHAPDAQRMLDFPHAAAYIQTIGERTGHDEATIGRARHMLKEQGASVVLPMLRHWVADSPTAAMDPDVTRALAYLEKRESHMDYPQFQADGWPIGSGIVESANKIVVEARLKGAGMHWKATNVNPLLALRNVVCNDRWEELWPQITAHLRTEAADRAQTRQRDRAAVAEMGAVADVVVLAPPTPSGMSMTPPPDPAPVQPEPPASATPKVNHPWRRAWSIRRQREIAGAV